MADKIQVAVRVRPVLSQKKDVEIHWDASEKGMVLQVDPTTKKRIGHPYLFDQVFAPDTTNYQIFNCVVGPLIDSAMKGFNVTVLAYGQTASGKTYTMMGSPTELGILQLAVDRIFTVIENSPEREFLLRCSYIEIYNETIQDLLSSSQQKLKVQELAEGNVVVQNLIEKNINTADAVMKLMQQGNKQRKVGGTSMNERSSRSHTIFRIIVESRLCSEEAGNDAAVTVSHINLVDLAGSEKASQTNATGDRFREGCAINTSLSALSLVIKQLSEGEGFVNFRDSKLTHILRASLGGNARTAIICNVTPTVLDETSSTLKFASSAKMVKNQPQVNEVLSDQALLRKYNNYIKDLEKKLKEKEIEKKPEAIEEMKKLLEEKDLKIQELKQQLVVSSSNESFVAQTEDIASKRAQRRMTWGGDVLKSFLKPAVAIETGPFMPSVPRPHRGSKLGDRVQSTAVTRRSRNNSFENIEECADFESVGTESFVEANQFFASANSSVDVSRVDAATMTDFPSQTPAKMSGTPAPVLRERLKMKQQEYEDLREELHELCSFTRLEQQIGVHSYSATKSADETAEQLRQAQQTANDMEILYMDTQKKFSALQSEYREKQASYEEELATQKNTFQNQLEAENSEKKALAKELAVLKEKCERMSRDQAEYDTHLAMVTERSAKREADLRKNLQEAWEQLEKMNGGPMIFTCGDCSQAKEQVQNLERQMKELERLNEEAQQQISSLNEELVRMKNPSKPAENSIFLDDSLSGMCLADELRNAFEEDISFAPSSSCRRPRKRPSSILSVALAKMDPSANETLDGVKRTRLSDPTSEGNCTDEIIVIRNHLMELQTVLLRYEEEFEVLSGEKESLSSQLQAALNQVAELNEQAKTVKRSSTPGQDPSSCTMDESHSMTMEQCSFDVSSLMADQTLSKPNDDLVAEKTKMEHDLRNANNQIRQLQEELVSTSAELTEAKESLEDAHNVIQKLQEVGSEQQDELTSTCEKIRSMAEELAAVSEELSRTRQMLMEASTKSNTQNSEEEEMSEKLLEYAEQIDALSAELESQKKKSEVELENCAEQIRQLHENLVSSASELTEARESLEDAKSVIQKMQEVGSEQQEELVKANERIRSLVEDLAAATEELSKTREDLTVMNSKVEACSMDEELSKELEQANEQLLAVKVELETEKVKLEQELLVAGNQIQQLQEDLASARQCLEVANQEIQKAQGCSTEGELNEANERIRSLVEELTAATEELSQARLSLLEANSKVELEHTEKEELGKKLNEVNEQMVVLQTEVESQNKKLEDELNRANNQIVQLQGELAVATSELLEAKEAQHEAQLQLEQVAQVDKIEVEAILLQKTAELEEACSRLQELEGFQDAVHQKSSELQSALSKISELEGVNENLRQKIADLEETCSRLEELEGFQDAAHQKSSELQSALSKISELECVNENLKQKIADLEEACSRATHLEGAGEVLQQQTVELEEARSRIVQLESANAALQEQAAELEETRSRISELESANAALQQKATALEEACSRLTALDGVSEALQIKTKELEDACSRISELETVNEALQQKTADMESSCSRVNEMESVSESLRLKTQELEIACSRVNELEVHNATLHQKTAELEEVCSRLKDLEGIDDVLLERTAKLDEACSRIKDLEDANEDMRKQVLERQEDCSRLKDLEGVGETLTQKTSELEQAYSRIKVLESASESNEKTVEEFHILQTELISKHTELAAAQQSLDDANEELQKLQIACNEQTDELNKVNEKVRSLVEELASVGDDLSKTRQRLQEAESKVELELSREGELRHKLEQATQQIESLTATAESEKNQLENEVRSAKHEIAQLQEDLATATSGLLEAKEAHHSAELRIQQLSQAADKTEVEKALQQKIMELQEACSKINELEVVQDALRGKTMELQEACSRINELEGVQDALQEKKRELQEACSRIRTLEDVYERNEKLHEEFCTLQTELMSKETELSAARQFVEHANDEILKLQKAGTEQQEELNKANEKIRFLAEELTATTDDLSRTRVFLKEANAKVELQHSTESELKVQLKLAGDQINELSDQLGARTRELMDAVGKAEKSSGEIQENLVKAQEQIAALQRETQLKSIELEAVCASLNEASVTIEELQSRGDPQKLQADLNAAVEEIQMLRRKLESATENLSKAEEKFVQLTRAQTVRGKNTPEPPIHCKLDLSVETLRRELAAAQARNETLQLQFETEEENRKKKIERLEKEIESLKEQYLRCKEELRLVMFRSSSEPTINVPKSKSLLATKDINIQTEPISDKGFGFRWQMEQYVADNERLRKKVSDLGEKMEYYKGKLLKYRGMYQELTGQSEANPKTESATATSTSQDSSTSTGEVITGANVRQLRERFSTPIAGSVPENRPVPGTIASGEGYSAGLRKPGTHAPSQFSGQKKETLTKEQMEKINNCNPS